MRKRKVGRPKGSKTKKVQIPYFTSTVKGGSSLGENTKEVKSTIYLQHKDWTISGLGKLADLHELLNQLEGVK